MIGDRGVGRDQIAEANADTAKPDGKPRRSEIRQRRIGTSSAEAGHEECRPDLVQHYDRRDVERLLKRLADGNRATIEAIEIQRGIVAKSGRAILNQALRQSQT